MSEISKNSKRTLGKMWITNGAINSMIEKNSIIPDGFTAGKTQKKKEKDE